MPKFDVLRLTGLTYSILTIAVILLALAIAEIVLEERAQHAFHTIQIQYPGSSLAEWLFVPMSPNYIDIGPAIFKFAIGTCSLFTALLAIAWIVLTWWAAKERLIRKLGVWSCITSVINTAGAIGFMVFVFVREAQNKLPQSYIQWWKSSFTREFWVCTAFPSIFDDADMLFGFRACDVALAAKYELIGICCVSVTLAGLSVLQAQKLFAFRTKEKYWDIEAMKASLKSNGLPNRRERAPRSTGTNGAPRAATTTNNTNIQRPTNCVRIDRSGLHGFYERL